MIFCVNKADTIWLLLWLFAKPAATSQLLACGFITALCEILVGTNINILTTNMLVVNLTFMLHVRHLLTFILLTSQLKTFLRIFKVAENVCDFEILAFQILKLDTVTGSCLVKRIAIK